jgi:arylformamidase
MLDIYATRRAGAPVNVYIHGGAWRSGLAKDYAFPAEMFNSAGAHYVVLDFLNVLEAGGNLMPMAEQVRRGVAWVYKNAASFGGDPNRVFVSGFSSGAHLAGVAHYRLAGVRRAG